MDTSKSHSRRACNLAFFLGIFLILFCSVKAENTTYPEANVNLTPFQEWRSAFYCLQNTSNSCPAKYKLDMSGWLNVTFEDTQTFCAAGGCAEHTWAVLDCIIHVKRDFWFANNASVDNVKDTINHGCKDGFTGMSIHSGGDRINSASIILLALVSLALLYV